MTKAIMNGCNGKMGQCITAICKEDMDIEIVAGIDMYDGIENELQYLSILKFLLMSCNFCPFLYDFYKLRLDCRF